jgi:hypothetical protein
MIKIAKVKIKMTAMFKHFIDNPLKLSSMAIIEYFEYLNLVTRDNKVIINIDFKIFIIIVDNMNFIIRCYH